MSAHKGFRITRRKGKTGTSFTVQVRNKKAGTYVKTKTFNSRDYESAKIAESVAKEWGATERAKILAGIKAGNSGKVKTQETLDLFFETRMQQDLDARHEKDVKAVLNKLPDFCPNLADEKAGKQVYEWWQDWSSIPRPQGGAKSATTKNRGLTHALTFVRWAFKSSQLTNLQEPVDVDWITKLREPQKVKPQFSVHELRTGLLTTTTTRKKVTKPHSFVIRWALGLYLGARSREALNLRWEDFNAGLVLLSGKGKKQRLVIMQSELEPYLKAHREDGHDYEGYLFPSQLRHADSGNLAKHFDSFLRKSKIKKNGRSTHSLRHCYAGMMVATGESTGLVQNYMGHADGDMTVHYSQLAARYRQDVEGWERGKIQLTSNAC